MNSEVLRTRDAKSMCIYIYDKCIARFLETSSLTLNNATCGPFY